MPVNTAAYLSIEKELLQTKTTLIAVSKTKPVSDLQEIYELGQRDFGENYVQELVDKQAVLPKDIRWHFIGHLQSNKVKYIAPFVHLIHGVDGFKLLLEINKQAAKNNRIIDCLLQIHIAQEETKFGLNEQELTEMQPQIGGLENIRICGFMGMASFTENQQQLKSEFQQLSSIAEKFKSICDLPPTVNGLQSSVYVLKPMILSMGMSSDYQLAIENGSNMVRIGSLLFGTRI